MTKLIIEATLLTILTKLMIGATLLQGGAQPGVDDDEGGGEEKRGHKSGQRTATRTSVKVPWKFVLVLVFFDHLKIRVQNTWASYNNLLIGISWLRIHRGSSSWEPVWLQLLSRQWSGWWLYLLRIIRMMVRMMVSMMVRMMNKSAQDDQDDGPDDGDIHQICSRGQLMVTWLKIRKFVLTLVQAQGTRRVQQKKR